MAHARGLGAAWLSWRWSGEQRVLPASRGRPRGIRVGDGALDSEASNVWKASHEPECARMEHQRAHWRDEVRTRWPRIGSGCVAGGVRQHQDLHRVQIGQQTEDAEELWVNRALGILGQHNRYDSEKRSECGRVGVGNAR
jgi:hypothetical protein